MNLVALSCSLLLAVGLGGSGSPGAPAPPAAIPPGPAGLEGAASFQDTIAVNQVLVPVVVRTRAGFADGLEPRDFQLLVDGRAVPIESFDKRTEAPTSLVLLQDLSGSMGVGGKLEQSREIARYFISRSLPGDELAIATFASGRGEVEVPFTTDTGALSDDVARWQAYGTTALHDAVAWIPDISSAGHNSRRFAILITDGVDNASAMTPEQARDVVREAQVPVYVLGLGSGSPYELSADGKKMYRYADVLNLLAGATGGRYYPIGKPEDLAMALRAIGDDLRHQYVLGFSTREGARTYRHLRVELKAKGLGDRATVVFRRGYTGPPPAGG